MNSINIFRSHVYQCGVYLSHKLHICPTLPASSVLGLVRLLVPTITNNMEKKTVKHLRMADFLRTVRLYRHAPNFFGNFRN